MSDDDSSRWSRPGATDGDDGRDDIDEHGHVPADGAPTEVIESNPPDDITASLAALARGDRQPASPETGRPSDARSGDEATTDRIGLADDDPAGVDASDRPTEMIGSSASEPGRVDDPSAASTEVLAATHHAGQPTERVERQQAPRPVTAEYPTVATGSAPSRPAPSQPGPSGHTASPRQATARRTPPRRRGRGPLFLRVLCGLLALASLAFGGLLMMSDTAPGVMLDVFGDRARSLWDRIDAGSSAELGATPPPADTVVHIVLWASVVFLLGLTLWSIWALIGLSILALAASVGVELAQQRWTDTRTFESRDVLANAVGVGIGVVAAAAIIAVWNLVAWLVRPRR